MDYFGIDIGTSFIKGGVLDIDNCKLGSVERIPSPEPYCDEQGMLHEVDPTRFVTAVRQIIGRLPVMEWTSTTSTLDVETRSWPGELIEQLHLGKLTWSEIVYFRHQVGRCEIESARIPVYAAVGDHQCAVAGTLLQEGELSINISTACRVFSS